MMLRWIGQAFYELVPFPRLLVANKLVARGSSDQDVRKQRWTGLGRSRLLELLDQEWERAKHLDDKLFKATTGLSVAVSAAGVASKTVLDSLSAGPFKVAITCVLLYAIASLFAGVIMGFKGLRPKQRPGYGPDFAVRTRRASQATSREIAAALMHFEIKNLIVSNEATAANMAMRNGVIAFALAMTTSLFIPSKPFESQVPDSHYVTIFSNSGEQGNLDDLDTSAAADLSSSASGQGESDRTSAEIGQKLATQPSHPARTKSAPH